MKTGSLAWFGVGVFVLGLSLLWFPDIIEIIANLMPVGTPAYISDFLLFLPWGILTIILIMYVYRLVRRRKREFPEE